MKTTHLSETSTRRYFLSVLIGTQVLLGLSVSNRAEAAAQVNCVTSAQKNSRNWGKPTYPITSLEKVYEPKVKDIGNSGLGNKSCSVNSELTTVNAELRAACHDKDTCSYSLDATRLSYCRDCPQKLVFEYKCSASDSATKTLEVATDTAWRTGIVLGNECPGRCPYPSGQSTARPSRWSVWAGTANQTSLSFDLSLGNRDSTGYIGESIEGDRGDRLDSINYDEKNGRIVFRRLVPGATQWYSGCVKWDPPPNPSATPSVAGTAKIVGKFSSEAGTAKAKPGESAFAHDFQVTAAYPPAAAPVDTVPLAAAGAEIMPIPVATYRLQVCSNPQPGTSATVREEESSADHGPFGIQFFNWMYPGVSSCFAATDPSGGSCTIYLTNAGSFIFYWGYIAQYGGDTPGCDQLLYQV